MRRYVNLFFPRHMNKMKIIVNPEYSFLSDFIEDLPARFPEDGEIIYEGRNTLKRYQVQGVDMIVKSFKIPIFINKVAYSFFRKSKACRSYEHALEILRRGGNTPAPVAYIEEYRHGLLYASFYVSVFDSRAVTIREYMDGSRMDAEDVWRSFVRFTIGMHRSGILHIDYSPGNVLMERKADGSLVFSLIDINRLLFKKVTPEDALRSFDRMALSVDVSTRLAEIYAEECSLDKAETVRKMNAYGDRFFLKRTVKEAAKQIKREKGKRMLLVGPLQEYFFLRWLRMNFLHGRKENCLYRKERELYLTYLKPKDDRQVLERKYHYT